MPLAQSDVRPTPSKNKAKKIKLVSTVDLKKKPHMGRYLKPGKKFEATELIAEQLIADGVAKKDTSK